MNLFAKRGCSPGRYLKNHKCVDAKYDVEYNSYKHTHNRWGDAYENYTNDFR